MDIERKSITIPFTEMAFSLVVLFTLKRKECLNRKREIEKAPFWQTRSRLLEEHTKLTRQAAQLSQMAAVWFGAGSS